VRVRTARMRALVAATCLVTGLIWTAPAAGPVHAATIRNVPGGYATIQAAVDAADPGDTIRVASGTYPGHTTVTKSLTIESVAGPEDTTLDGNFDGSPIIAAALETGETLTVTGLRFWRGEAYINDAGGAIRANGAGSLVVTDSIFESNHADAGGAILANLEETTTIERNTFVQNGGLYGAALYLGAEGEVVIRTNLFLANEAANWGGAIYRQTVDPSTATTISSNTMVWNDAPLGSAIHTSGPLDLAVFRNNVIVGNSDAALLSCADSNSDATFQTNDLWHTDAGDRYAGDCDSSATAGDLNIDPLFAVPDWDDYHLRADSPLIDAGTADPGVTTDIDGESRPFDGDEAGGAQIDIGFDEATDPLLIKPGSRWFGQVNLGEHIEMDVDLGNLGTGDLTISAVSVTGDDAAQFDTVTDGCSATVLSVDETCTVKARFVPTVTGIQNAFLTITGPGAVGTREIPLTGDGVNAIVTGGGSFGDVAVGSTKAGSISITNASTADSVTLTAAALSGDNAGDFVLTNTACVGTPIPPQQSCAINVSFTPHAVGDRDATVDLTFGGTVGTRYAAVAGRGIAPTTPVTWGTPTKPGGSYAWNFGNALARTVRDGSQRLHQAYATDRISGTWAKDSGPYAGIYYTRSTSGSTWTTPRRITSTSRHVVRFGLAAAGSRVYVAYVTQTKIVNYSGTAPRVLYVRVNTNHGHGDYWKSSVRLTGTTGRVDFPTVAASGTDVHIAFTNSNNGDVIVATSKDRGVTWAKRTVGTTTFNTTSGRAGLPSIAVSGSTVAVTWIADGSRALKTRISTDRGTTWGTTEMHDDATHGEFQTAVLGSRVGVTWTDGGGIYTRLRVAGVWEDTRVAVEDAGFFRYSPAIALSSTSRVAISWAEDTATTNWTALMYAESTNNGVAWYKAQTIASTSTSTRRANDYPSIVWPSTGTRYVSWNGWTSGTNSYRLYMRKGTGTPAGLAEVAPIASIASLSGGEVMPASALRVPKADGTRPR
jgi:hypothetical protein